MLRRAGLWGPVAGWMGVLYGASAQTFSQGGPSVPDWLTHGSAYAVLGGLLCRALAGGLTRPLSLQQALLAVVLSSAYGVTDELHQAFVPNRHADPWDVAKDGAGATVAAGLCLAVGRRRGGQGSAAPGYHSRGASEHEHEA